MKTFIRVIVSLQEKHALVLLSEEGALKSLESVGSEAAYASACLITQN